MSENRKSLWYAWWLLTAIVLLGGLVLVLRYTPEAYDPQWRPVPLQKLFYLHLPSAISTFLASLICFVGSIGYLAHRQSRWDDLAAAGAKVSVLFCSIVLVTGMIWGHAAWGHWWTWSPRLTFSLVLWLLYVVYLMVRSSVESSQRRAIISAVYGVIAFLDVPLVYLSVRMMPDIHPRDIALAPEMKLTLALCFLPVLMLAGGLVVRGFRRNQALRAQRERRGFPVEPIVR
jgi:heme exporter protein C